MGEPAVGTQTGCLGVILRQLAPSWRMNKFCTACNSLARRSHYIQPHAPQPQCQLYPRQCIAQCSICRTVQHDAWLSSLCPSMGQQKVMSTHGKSTLSKAKLSSSGNNRRRPSHIIILIHDAASNSSMPPRQGSGASRHDPTLAGNTMTLLGRQGAPSPNRLVVTMATSPHLQAAAAAAIAAPSCSLPRAKHLKTAMLHLPDV